MHSILAAAAEQTLAETPVLLPSLRPSGRECAEHSGGVCPLIVVMTAQVFPDWHGDLVYDDGSVNVLAWSAWQKKALSLLGFEVPGDGKPVTLQKQRATNKDPSRLHCRNTLWGGKVGRKGSDT